MMEQIKTFFDSIVMEETCAQRIEQALLQLQNNPTPNYQRRIPAVSRRFPSSLVAICLAVILILPCCLLTYRPHIHENSLSSAASVSGSLNERLSAEERENQRLHELLTLIKEKKTLKDAIEQYEAGFQYREGRITYDLSAHDTAVHYNTLTHSPFTDYENGRVWFVANGENLDITELFSEEEPFTYIFTDSNFMEHYIAIGGTPENIGYLEMLHTSWEEKPFSFVCGFAINTWNNQLDQRYGWETKAKEVFNEYGVYWTS